MFKFHGNSVKQLDFTNVSPLFLSHVALINSEKEVANKILSARLFVIRGLSLWSTCQYSAVVIVFLFAHLFRIVLPNFLQCPQHLLTFKLAGSGAFW